VLPPPDPVATLPEELVAEPPARRVREPKTTDDLLSQPAAFWEDTTVPRANPSAKRQKEEEPPPFPKQTDDLMPDRLPPDVRERMQERTVKNKLDTLTDLRRKKKQREN
jgi:hypothetical protein